MKWVMTMNSDLHRILKVRNTEIQRFKNRNIRSNKKISSIDVPEGLYDKCSACGNQLLTDDIIENCFVCPNCGEHFRMRATERIQMLVDEGSFREKGVGFESQNPFETTGYEDKLQKAIDSTGLEEAYVYGYAKIEGEDFIIGVLDSHFMMGSMGSVVGEKVTRSFELAMQVNLPIVLFSASGGARMHEGILSLMQMAKTSQAISKFNEKGLLYIAVLTNPTTGGVTASFAMLGDITLAEPKALIGFAGPRVIKQTTGQDLPEGFQRSEFLQEQGFVDAIVERKELRNTLGKILKLHK